MTADVSLDTYPMGDEPQDNLQRMFADMKQVDRARRYLDEVLRTGTGVSIIAVDLDRSAVVRRRGVGEKRRLVMQLHALIRSHIPQTATFLDSGSRDEGWIVLLGHDAGAALRLAEQIRLAIAGHGFRLADGEDVRLTASLGIVRSPLHGSIGQDLLWAAGETLWQAKLTRNTVYAADAPIATLPRSFPVTADQQRKLAALARHSDRSIDSLVHEALQLVLENHAPRWHWLVDKRGPTAGGPGELATGRARIR